MLRLPVAAHADKRGGLDFTHFVSLPLTSPGLQQQYAQYTAALMADPELATYRVVPQVRGGLPTKPCAYARSRQQNSAGITRVPGNPTLPFSCAATPCLTVFGRGPMRPCGAPPDSKTHH